MRSKIAFLFFYLFLFCTIVKSQQTISLDAEAFYKKAMSSINTKHIAWIKSTAVNVKAQDIDEAGMRKLASDYGRGFNLSNMAVECAITLMFMLIADDARNDQKNLLEEMTKARQKKQSLREAMQIMEQCKNEVSRQILDSFKLMTTTRTTTVTKPQIAGIQTVPTATKANTPIVTKVSDVEIKEVQEGIKIELDSINKLGEAQRLQMQKQMDKRTKMIEIINNSMKKISQAQDSIIQNMK